MTKHEPAPRLPEPDAGPWAARVRQSAGGPGRRHGHALVLGVGSGQLVEQLLRQSELQVLVVEPEGGQAAAWRARWDQAGWYGPRVAVLGRRSRAGGLPPYFARLIVSEDSRVGRRVHGGAARPSVPVPASLRRSGLLRLTADEAARLRRGVRGGRAGGRGVRRAGRSVAADARRRRWPARPTTRLWFQPSPDQRVGRRWACCGTPTTSDSSSVRRRPVRRRLHAGLRSSCGRAIRPATARPTGWRLRPTWTSTPAGRWQPTRPRRPIRASRLRRRAEATQPVPAGDATRSVESRAAACPASGPIR